MVHLFSGPDDRVDGLAAYLSKLRVPCVDLDIVIFRQGEIKSSHDLSSDSLWETLRSELEGGRILALWFGTPCSTFSKARGHGPGPRPLRSVQHIYGLPRSELRESEHQQVREGTYFALKTCELAQAAHRLGVASASKTRSPGRVTSACFFFQRCRRWRPSPMSRVRILINAVSGRRRRSPRDFSPLDWTSVSGRGGVSTKRSRGGTRTGKGTPVSNGGRIPHW